MTEMLTNVGLSVLIVLPFCLIYVGNEWRKARGRARKIKTEDYVSDFLK